MHLDNIKEMYRNQGKIQEKIKKYMLDYNDYPNGLYKLFYFLRVSVKFLEKYGGFFPALFDLCLLLLTIFFVHLFGGDNAAWLIAFPFLRLFIANEGRSSNFSERAYGGLWGNIFLASMVAYYLNDNSLWLLSALCSFTVFSISSKFTWQGTFLITLLLSIFEQSLFFIAVYSLSLMTSVIVSRGYSYKVLKGVIRHCVFYEEHLSPKCLGLANHYKNFFKAFTRTSIREKAMLFMTNSVFKLVSDNPLNIAIIFLMISQPSEWNVFYSWGLAGITLLLLISLEPLKFLGEPERYLEFSIIPVFVILSQNTVPFIITLAIITGGFMIYMLHWGIFINAYKTKSDMNERMQELLDFFASINDKVILSIPLRNSFFLAYFNNNNRFVTLFFNIGRDKEKEDYRELTPDYYPYPGKNLTLYIKKHGINYLVVEKDRLKVINEKMNETYYSFKRYKTAYENKNYIVYKV